MKILVSEATKLQIDWLVAKAQGYSMYLNAYLNGSMMEGFWVSGYYPGDLNSWVPLSKFSPSTNWSQGGPLIEREVIDLTNICPGTWRATNVNHWFNGPTPLIAAMRCYVASKLGNEVEIPDELA